jgi:hypothetical protein
MYDCEVALKFSILKKTSNFEKWLTCFLWSYLKWPKKTIIKVKPQNSAIDSQ